MSNNVGTAIDKVYTIDQKIDVIELALKKLKKERAKHELSLLKILQSSNAESAASKLARANIDRREYPSIKDRKAFEKFAIKNGALDLFQGRVSVEAWRSRRGAGQEVPGVTVFEKVSVKVRGR